MTQFRACWSIAIPLAVSLALALRADLAQAQEIDRQQFVDWGLETQDEIWATLRRPRTYLYAETAHLDGGQSGGVGGNAFAWPVSTELRVLNSLTRHDAGRFASRLRGLSDSFHNLYWSPAGGYWCCSGGGDRFYDDNAHIAVALAEAYEITGEAVYLNRAEATYDFLLTGEAPGASGGSYWSVNDHTFLDSAAALQGARAGAMLYQATGDQEYLDNAVLRYNWARDNTQLPGGTFLEKVFLTGPNAGEAGNFDLVNFAGFGISANLALYDATGQAAYLNEAQRIANTSLSRYFDGATGRLNDEGYWAFELADALVDLSEHDGNQRWATAVAGALEWLHDNKQDPEGHYGVFWGRNGPVNHTLDEWSLNDMASVARAYLHLGLSRLPGEEITGDYNGDGVLNLADYTVWRDSLGASGAELAADGNADEIVDQADYEVWKMAFGTTTPAKIGNAQVPEPTAVLLMVGAMVAGGGVCRRRHAAGKRRRASRLQFAEFFQ